MKNLPSLSVKSLIVVAITILLFGDMAGYYFCAATGREVPAFSLSGQVAPVLKSFLGIEDAKR